MMQNIRELCLRAQSQTNTHTQHSTRGGRARVSATQAAGWSSTEAWGSTGFAGSTAPKYATQGILDSVKQARQLSPDAPARLLDADGAGAFGLLLLAAAQDLPEAKRLVGSGGGDRGAVGALRHVQHAARVPA